MLSTISLSTPLADGGTEAKDDAGGTRAQHRSRRSRPDTRRGRRGVQGCFRGAPLVPSALLLCFLCLSGCEHKAGWEKSWTASQVAWAEHDDAERALGLLEAAISQHPPADAEAEMIRALVPILENVQDEKRVISALGDDSSQLFRVLVSAPNVVFSSRRPRCRHGRV